MEGPSPRYFAVHRVMPLFLETHGIMPFLDAIAREDDSFFIPVWMEAGFRFRPMFLERAAGAMRFGVLSLPMPRQTTEAYMAVFVGDNRDASVCHYFVQEKSVSFVTAADGSIAMGDGTVLGGWRDGTHLNYGSGPPSTGDFTADASAMIDAILAALKPAPVESKHEDSSKSMSESASGAKNPGSSVLGTLKALEPEMATESRTEEPSSPASSGVSLRTIAFLILVLGIILRLALGK
jgi:hypothetical protein